MNCFASCQQTITLTHAHHNRQGTDIKLAFFLISFISLLISRLTILQKTISCTAKKVILCLQIPGLPHAPSAAKTQVSKTLGAAKVHTFFGKITISCPVFFIKMQRTTVAPLRKGATIRVQPTCRYRLQKRRKRQSTPLLAFIISQSNHRVGRTLCMKTSGLAPKPMR